MVAVSPRFTAASTGPMKIAEVTTPMKIAICCLLGVAPTICAVLRSWAVVPPLLAAIPTMAAVVRAANRSSGEVQPRTRYTRQVSSSVATVIPEMGLEELPISPVIRELTVTKKKPATTISRADTRFTWSGGDSQMSTTSSTEPPTTTLIGRSRSVRGTSTTTPRRLARKVRTLRRKASTMLGIERTRLISPPAATAPAPM